jgi:hypothetical protein
VAAHSKHSSGSNSTRDDVSACLRKLQLLLHSMAAAWWAELTSRIFGIHALLHGLCRPALLRPTHHLALLCCVAGACCVSCIRDLSTMTFRCKRQGCTDVQLKAMCATSRNWAWVQPSPFVFRPSLFTCPPKSHIFIVTPPFVTLRMLKPT